MGTAIHWFWCKPVPGSRTWKIGRAKSGSFYCQTWKGVQYSLHCVSTYCNENIHVQAHAPIMCRCPMYSAVQWLVCSAHNAALNQVQCRLTKGAAIRHHHIPLSLKTRSLLISHPRHIAAGSAPCISCAQQNLVMDLGTEKCLNALN